MPAPRDPYVIVWAWNNRAEHGYYFGPFVNAEAADRFIDAMPHGWVDARVNCLNAPGSLKDGTATDFEPG